VKRAELAHSLVGSLDGPADADTESAWDAEILRLLARPAEIPRMTPIAKLG